MTTDREDLYQQAWRAYLGTSGPMSQAAFRVPGPGIRAAVDLVLDAQPAERPDWEVLREADKLIRGHWNFDGIDSTRLLALAKDLEAEHRAAQEKAEREAEREKLIEQAARVLIAQPSPSTYEALARALADAGLLSAPTTDGGAA